ncbi:MAG: hypothetical protein AAB250_08930, partial [Bdellovibrionota bacterium]
MSLEPTARNRIVRILFFAGLAILLSSCFVLLKRTVPFEIQTLLGKEHPQRLQYEADLESFDDEGVVWLVVKKPTAFAPNELQDVAERIGRHLDMDDSFGSVTGPHNAKYIEFDESGFKLVPFLENGTWTAHAKENLQTEMWRGALIRDD